MAHAARDFFKDFDVLGPEISKFLLVRRGLGECGVGGGVGTGQMLEHMLKLTARANVVNTCSTVLVILSPRVTYTFEESAAVPPRDRPRRVRFSV